MKPLFYFLGFGILICASCTNQNTHDDNNKKIIELDEFTTVNLSDKAKLITDDPNILGTVSLIRYINDSIIAVCQSRTEPHVALYNLNTGEVQPAIIKGSGPDEMLRVSTMSVDSSNNLWLAGLMDRKVMKVKWNQNGEKASVEQAFKLPEDYLRGVTDFEGGIIGLPSIPHTKRIITLDSMGELRDSLGVYPIINMPDDVIPNNLIFQSDIAFNPETKKIMLVCRSWNFIDIIDAESKEIINLEYPIPAPIQIERTDFGEAFSYDPKPLWLMFSGVETTPESFLVGLIGKEVKSPEDFDSQINSIMEFDMEGNEGRLFKFNNDILAFTISDDGSRLFTIENNPEPALYEYLILKQ